jgi:hypothetical protein
MSSGSTTGDLFLVEAGILHNVQTDLAPSQNSYSGKKVDRSLPFSNTEFYNANGIISTYLLALLLDFCIYKMYKVNSGFH